MRQLLSLLVVGLFMCSLLVPALAAQESEGGEGGPAGQEGGWESEPTTSPQTGEPLEVPGGTQPTETLPGPLEPGGGEEPPENVAGGGGLTDFRTLTVAFTILIILVLAVFLFKKARVQKPSTIKSEETPETEPELSF
ncbi:MAG: hypothetical protein QXG38_00695 [Candidatus Hadarchaeales archaeon]